MRSDKAIQRLMVSRPVFICFVVAFEYNLNSWCLIWPSQDDLGSGLANISKQGKPVQQDDYNPCCLYLTNLPDDPIASDAGSYLVYVPAPPNESSSVKRWLLF